MSQNPVPRGPATALVHRGLRLLVEDKAQCPVADGRYFQGNIRKVSVGDKRFKLTVFHLLLVISKVEDLMRVYYKNSVNNKNN